MGRKRKRPPPTPEEALLNALSDRAHALYEIVKDMQVDLIDVNAGIIRIYEILGKGGELRLEELKPIEEKIGALEAKPGRA